MWLVLTMYFLSQSEMLGDKQIRNKGTLLLKNYSNHVFNNLEPKF